MQSTTGSRRRRAMRSTTAARRRTAMRWAGRVVLGLWVALSVLTWAPRLGEAADATVTGTGRFVFRKFVGAQLVEVGIKRARVEMCDDDGVFGCQLMAVGETDDDGHFSVTGRAGDFFGDLPDPLVKVIAQSDAATVEDTGVWGAPTASGGIPASTGPMDRPSTSAQSPPSRARAAPSGATSTSRTMPGSSTTWPSKPATSSGRHAGHPGSRRSLGQGAVARGSHGVRSARLVLAERHDLHWLDQLTRTLLHEK